nr:MAG TPA: hypothetical protein [Caudoviricetes sp.]
MLFFVYSDKCITISLCKTTIVIYRYRDIISSIKDQPRQARQGTKGEQNMKKYFNVSFQYSDDVFLCQHRTRRERRGRREALFRKIRVVQGLRGHRRRRGGSPAPREADH